MVAGYLAIGPSARLGFDCVKKKWGIEKICLIRAEKPHTITDPTPTRAHTPPLSISILVSSILFLRRFIVRYVNPGSRTSPYYVAAWWFIPPPRMNQGHNPAKILMCPGLES